MVAARMMDEQRRRTTGRGSGVHSAGDGRRLHIRLRHHPPFLIVESLSISKPRRCQIVYSQEGVLDLVRMYVGYCRLRKIWEMSAKANTNCHNILNFVSATRTHWAKIGATRCVVADMSRHVGDISS